MIMVISNFSRAFKRGSFADSRPFLMRVRHGLIAALAGRSTVIVNGNLSLADTIYLKTGDMVVGNSIRSTAQQKAA